MTKLDNLFLEMTDYYNGDPKRIFHFSKVHSLASLIANCEGLDNKSRLIIEAAALVHDIGIKPAEEKFGSCGGELQQKEGPYPAWQMLEKLGFPTDVISRVCFIVAHHHTYENVEGLDWRIILEADFLVNAFEDDLSNQAIESGAKKILHTQTAKDIFKKIYAEK